MVASAQGQQSVANVVTTPTFNRKTNPTKLFNLHNRAEDPERNVVALETIVEGLAVDIELYLKKVTGSIYCDKRVLVSVVTTCPETARLDWCRGKRIELGIWQAAVEQQFANCVVTGLGLVPNCNLMPVI